MTGPFEAIIIGGGPAGLTAGLYLRRAGINTVLLEKVLPGGAPLNTWRVENYPGFPNGISGRELMDRFAAQVKTFDLPVREFTEAGGLSLEAGRFTVRVNDGELKAPGVIVAIGTEPVVMGIPGEKELIGRGISFCATCDGTFFKDLDVAVIGGGDSAIEEALSLANIVRKVYVIHRRDSLRAQKILQERALSNPKMEFLWNRRPVAVEGKDQVERIILERVGTNEREALSVSGVFVYVGSRPSTAFLGDLVQCDDAGFIITDEELATRTKGLYAAGDVRKKTLRQISTAVGDGALAAVSLERYLLALKG